MRTISVFKPLLLVAIVVASVGAILSSIGYERSLQSVQIATTQPLETTSVSISTEAFSSTSDVSIIHKYQFTIPATEGYFSCYTYYLTRDNRPYHVNEGQIHVTLSTNIQPGTLPGIDFWVLTESQFPAWNQSKSCEGVELLQATYFKSGVLSYDGNISIPVTGSYYFAFLNYDNMRVSVTISVSELTTIQEETEITQTTVLSTQQVTTFMQPVGLGLPFYGGITLFVGGIVVFVTEMFTLRRKHEFPEVVQRPQKETMIKPGICPVCGTQLLRNARFCKKCGTSVDQT